MKHEKLDRKSAVVIGTLLVTAFIGMFNETALGVAIPQVMKDLNITESTGQWLNTTVMLTFAVVIPITGYMQVRFSRRRLFLYGMITFSVGTLLCAWSPTLAVLLAGRVVQAAGGGIMFPLLMNTIMNLVPENIRGRIMGNIGIVMAVAPALGPTFSGFVLSFSGWRTIFWIILPICVIATIFGFNKVKGEREKTEAHIDWPSFFISAIAFSGTIYGLSSFADLARGTALVSPYIPLGIGLLAMSWFIRRQNRLSKTDQALLDLNTFRSRNFALSVAVLVATCTALFGLAILVPIFAQKALGLSALETGLMLLPGTLFNGLISPYVGALSDRFGAAKLLRPGIIVVAASLLYMSFFDLNTQGWQIFVSNFILSAGLALVFTPLFTVSADSLIPKLYPHGTAISGTAQQIAGALGTAMMIVLYTYAYTAGKSAYVSDAQAAANGSHWAFLGGFAITLIAIPLTFAIKPKPKSEVIR